MRKTLRKQWRYIFFKLDMVNSSIDTKTLSHELSKAVLRFFGEYLFGDVAFKLVEYEPGKMSGTIKVDRKYVNQMLGCIALISKINGAPTHVKAIGVSGTLRAGREKFL